MSIIDIIKQRDKQIHFSAGFVIALLFGCITGSLWLAFFSALGLGLLKDVVWDYWLGQGSFEVLDIISTTTGSLPVILVMWGLS